MLILMCKVACVKLVEIVCWFFEISRSKIWLEKKKTIPDKILFFLHIFFEPPEDNVYVSRV